ncbi:hypothetical protein Ancab_039742 [Ancistrocladus abbreviatus]
MARLMLLNLQVYWLPLANSLMQASVIIEGVEFIMQEISMGQANIRKWLEICNCQLNFLQSIHSPVISITLIGTAADLCMKTSDQTYPQTFMHEDFIVMLGIAS